VPSRIASALVGAIALAALAAPEAILSQQVLFKWTDAEGKIQYSDRPPKDFKGPVTRIEPMYEKESPILPKPVAAPPEARKESVEPVTDLAAKRRAIRKQLEARLTQARDNLEAAKKALTEAAPELDERQVIQQRAASGGMHGMTGRSNCRQEVGGDGRKVLMCPTMVAGPTYFDRVAKLEQALARAEEELSAAELAWRRGVD